MMRDVPVTTVEALSDRYQALLFDAYGVLVHADGPLPGAVELLRWLRQAGKPFYVVTNSAARLPEVAAERYRRFGLDLQPTQIITAGSLLGPYLRAAGLLGCRCASSARRAPFATSSRPAPNRCRRPPISMRW
ncbi:hypothetical protein JCM19379_14440 [Methyloparacoccus murrellii]